MMAILNLTIFIVPSKRCCTRNLNLLIQYIYFYKAPLLELLQDGKCFQDLENGKEKY
jgi:hypothetical protein